MTDAIRELFELLTKKEKSGSDYTGTVTRVDGKTAYVQFDGSDITDTPVALSIGAKAGDSVRVRVADGRAWLVGNDDAPPNDSSEVGYELALTNALIRQLTTEQINGENGWINLLLGTFNYGDKLVWNGKELTLNGKVIATSGKIGGFTIEDDALINEDYIEIYPYSDSESGGAIKVKDASGNESKLSPSRVNVQKGSSFSYMEPAGVYTSGVVRAGRHFIEGNTALEDKYQQKLITAKCSITTHSTYGYAPLKYNGADISRNNYFVLSAYVVRSSATVFCVPFVSTTYNTWFIRVENYITGAPVTDTQFEANFVLLPL